MRRKLFGLLATAALLLGAGAMATSAAQAGGRGKVKPSIVFVHGAFADASGFTPTIKALQKRGYPVYAPPNPLRSLSGDAAYVRSFLEQVPGPIVVVGHSYGGAVLTNAAAGNPNVKALVYVAAFALDQNETVQAATELGGGHTDLVANLEFKAYPDAPDVPGSPTGKDLDAYIKQSAFRTLFAADVPPADALAMAATQRPGTLLSLGEPSGVPAWRTIPSWFLIARNDKTIPPEAQRVMAARAGATTREITSSHAVMVSHPQAVTDLVLTAVR